MQCKKLCSLAKPLENTTSNSPLYTSCFVVQCFLCWPLKTTHKFLQFFFPFASEGGNKVNVSCVELALRCWKVCLVELSDRDPNPTNDPHVTQYACMCLQKDFKQWMPQFPCFSFSQVHNRPFTTRRMLFFLRSNYDVWHHFSSMNSFCL